ncbi:MAG: two-component system response regulator [Gammaproteobacteria bacterium HGW-Gammaproteobacteria-3]|nr:MAG: two-component system response regulator [Gammaproteobacteria bacterium HGW-Gammaproteobacteria-3]
MCACPLKNPGSEKNPDSEMQILIVDDEPKVRQSLAEILELSGYQPVQADNVASAIRLLATRRFQLVLLDLNMPIQDGHSLLEYIAHHKVDVHALIISGEATFTQATRVLRFNFVQEFIKKPYTIEVLLHSINNALEKARLKVENRNVQARLKKSEQMHRFFVESSPDIIYMLNGQGEFVFLNHALKAVLGYSKKELMGRHYSTLIYPEDLEKAKYAFNERRTGERSTKVIELRLCCKNSGEPKYVETCCITIVLSSKGIYRKKHDQQEFVGTYGVIRDINERKLSENTVRKLNLAVENSPNLIIITDKNGTIEYVNQKITEISGYTIPEVIGRNPSLFQSGDTPAQDYQQLWETITSGQVWRGELKNKKKNGEIYWSRLSIAPMRDADGAISNYVAIQEDVTETLKLTEQIAYQATHDPLTDLINRSEFDRRLKRVAQSARAEQSEHALCYLDLDQFKKVNDTCNHSAGDELLRQLSRQISQQIRQRDTLARLGGDEFAVLMEHCTLEQARQTAEKIRKVVEQFQFRWENHSFRIGVSIGLVAINADSAGIETLLKQADMACLKAKELGRNRTHVFLDDNTHAPQKGEAGWPIKIHEALENNGFRLYRQSIMPFAAEKGEHYEILLRMIDKQGEVVVPGVFLPAAERYQLALKIDQWVIHAVFDWYVKNPERLNALMLCAINLSASSAADAAMAGFIVEELGRCGLPTEKFCFEINETVAISNLTLVTEFIKRIKDLGCRFALDDFGGGLSSFSYLKSLPVDFLKIDGVVVRNIADDAVNRVVVKAINDIAHVMGKKTIAKHAENDDDLSLLKKLGLDYAQGFGNDRPEPLQ